MEPFEAEVDSMWGGVGSNSMCAPNPRSIALESFFESLYIPLMGAAGRLPLA